MIDLTGAGAFVRELGGAAGLAALLLVCVKWARDRRKLSAEAQVIEATAAATEADTDIKVATSYRTLMEGLERRIASLELRVDQLQAEKVEMAANLAVSRSRIDQLERDLSAAHSREADLGRRLEVELSRVRALEARVRELETAGGEKGAGGE